MIYRSYVRRLFDLFEKIKRQNHRVNISNEFERDGESENRKQQKKKKIEMRFHVPGIDTNNKLFFESGTFDFSSYFIFETIFFCISMTRFCFSHETVI